MMTNEEENKAHMEFLIQNALLCEKEFDPEECPIVAYCPNQRIHVQLESDYPEPMSEPEPIPVPDNSASAISKSETTQSNIRLHTITFPHNYDKSANSNNDDSSSESSSGSVNEEVQCNNQRLTRAQIDELNRMKAARELSPLPWDMLHQNPNQQRQLSESFNNKNREEYIPIGIDGLCLTPQQVHWRHFLISDLSDIIPKKLKKGRRRRSGEAESVQLESFEEGRPHDQFIFHIPPAFWYTNDLKERCNDISNGIGNQEEERLICEGFLTVMKNIKKEHQRHVILELSIPEPDNGDLIVSFKSSSHEELRKVTGKLAHWSWVRSKVGAPGAA